MKVVDLFAGPGGLGEGFSSYRSPRDGTPVFDVGVSIEKDAAARETLKLRKFFRCFDGEVPADYYNMLRGDLDQEALYDRFPQQSAAAEKRALKAELGKDVSTACLVRSAIQEFLNGSDDPWVLVGGPPCQAYSLVGRARNRGNPTYDPAHDVRQRLYVEYLQILVEHAPAVFVMENVKGLLSASLNEQALFRLIINDLRDPVKSLKRDGRVPPRTRRVTYRIYSVSRGTELGDNNLADAVVRCEEYGVPQARHRVILIGVRSDINNAPAPLHSSAMVPAGAVLADLPALRSGLSHGDSDASWLDFLRRQRGSRWATTGTHRVAGEVVAARLQEVLRHIRPAVNGRGAEFVPHDVGVKAHTSWYVDRRMEGVTNHSARGHMERDLLRYLYAATYAQVYGKSPVLREFPTDLLPDHFSAASAVKVGGHFADRFRVQVAERPSSTVVSHISKDGHYYIHPDPMQCRSLTVREAARLQTFPDNYFFCGPRTAQYIQVGNAVPPLLAIQIAERVSQIFTEESIGR